MRTTPRIAVVGAGPGGLLCAQVLQRHGVEVTVHDADAAVDARDPGGVLDMHADSGQTALADAGLLDAFHRVARPEAQAKTRRDQHGTVLSSFVPEPDDIAAPEIDRGQLRALLAAHVEPGTVRWGHKLVRGVPLGEGRHRLEFANGDTAEADLVIGADGAWSRVRPLVTDAVPRYSGVLFLDVRFDDVDARHPHLAEMVGDGHLFATDGGGRALILQRNSNAVVRGFVGLRAPADLFADLPGSGRQPDADAVRARLLDEFSGWDSSLLPFLTDTDGGYTVRGLHALPAPLTWERTPGVTLLGDAAHLMSPFGGFGANLAMLDAAELARAVAEALASGHSTEDAVARYEAVMLPRSGEQATGANGALDRFFGVEGAGPAHIPDHAAEHRRYEQAAAEYRRRRESRQPHGAAHG